MTYKKKSLNDQAPRSFDPLDQRNERPRTLSVDDFLAAIAVDLVDPIIVQRLIKKIEDSDSDLSTGILNMTANEEKFERLYRIELRKRENELESKVLSRLGLSKLEFSRLSTHELTEKSEAIESGELVSFLRRKISEKIMAEVSEAISTAELNAISSFDVRPTYAGKNKHLIEKIHEKLCKHGPHGVLASLCLKIQAFYFEKKEKDEYTKKSYPHEKIVRLLGNVSKHLSQHPNLVTGWGISKVSDKRHSRFRRTEFDTVFHLELPNGPVTWPVMGPLTAPKCDGVFAGKQPSEERVLRFAELVLDKGLASRESGRSML